MYKKGELMEIIEIYNENGKELSEIIEGNIIKYISDLIDEKNSIEGAD